MGLIRYTLSKIPYSDRIPVVRNYTRQEEVRTPVQQSAEFGPQQRLHSAMLRNREDEFDMSSIGSADTFERTNVQQKTEYYENMARDHPLFLSRRSSGSSTRCTLDSPYAPQDRLKTYLCEQNDKFDALISSNLDVVMKDKKTTKDRKSDKNLVRGVIDGLIGSVLGTPEQPQPSVDPNAIPPSPTPCDDSDDDVDQILDSLDSEGKRRLYMKLKREMDASRSDADSLDKLQSFLIVSIKLYVIFLRLLIPVSRYVWDKFQNNEIYLVNSKNTQSLFDFTLRLMHRLEGRLEEKEQRKDDLKLDSLYEEYTLKASNALSEQLSARLLPESAWKRNIVDYILKREKKEEVEDVDYSADPRYSKFYSRGESESLPMSVLKAAELFVDEF